MEPFGGVDTSQLLVKAMMVARENHRVIANNIANADTPHFNPTELDFQATLRQAIEGRGRISLRKSDPRHFSRTTEGTEFEGLAFLSKNDYNKVDLDDQVAKLGKNTSAYTTYGSLLVKQFDEAKTVLDMLR